MNIPDSLILLNSTKAAIAAAIEEKDIVVGDIPFSEYPEKIRMITTSEVSECTRPGIIENGVFIESSVVSPSGVNSCAFISFENNDINFWLYQ
jgi:hypothetical protein